MNLGKALLLRSFTPECTNNQGFYDCEPDSCTLPGSRGTRISMANLKFGPCWNHNKRYEGVIATAFTAYSGNGFIGRNRGTRYPATDFIVPGPTGAHIALSAFLPAERQKLFPTSDQSVLVTASLHYILSSN
ncbi:hypothetical protein O181_065253 [Austropuccinia psidii MF-1]|uniref:Uncharacterized protein n=1 Tax=Austropuccinia psidii MF-1 TaxID=1389203 RepID=A0A9Q3EV15_9BASI|nr:hypothetical protein [Austropuccinia psidii MF-1]